MFLADIGDTVDRGFATFFEWVPRLLGALAVLVIGYFVAKAIANVLQRVLSRAGFDRLLHGGPAGGFVQKITSRPSHLLSRVAFWALMFGVVSIAAGILGIEVLEEFVAAVWGYLPNIIAALAIFLVAGAIAAGIATLVGRVMGDTGLGKIVATVAPILVMTIATFMILEQLRIAHDIVVTTYTLLLGAVALGSALAFGLGGRDVARDLLQGAYQKGQENKEQFRQDLETGKQRGREQLDDAKSRMQDGGTDQDSGTEQAPEPTSTTTVRVTPPPSGSSSA